jgi:hypothetical protein
MTIKCGLCPACKLATPNSELIKGIEIDEFGAKVFQCPGCLRVFDVERAAVMGWTTAHFNDGNLEDFDVQPY